MDTSIKLEVIDSKLGKKLNLTKSCELKIYKDLSSYRDPDFVPEGYEDKLFYVNFMMATITRKQAKIYNDFVKSLKLRASLVLPGNVVVQRLGFNITISNHNRHLQQSPQFVPMPTTKASKDSLKDFWDATYRPFFTNYAVTTTTTAATYFVQ